MTLKQYVRHANQRQAIRRASAIDAALGYPREASYRGIYCRPTLDGRTERFASPVQDRDGTWCTESAPESVVGRVERVGGEDVVISNDGAEDLRVVDEIKREVPELGEPDVLPERRG